MQTLTTYSVLFKFCFFSNSIIMPAKDEVCTGLPKKWFEMATQPFRWLSLHHSINPQFIISLGRLNNCSSAVQQLSRSWGRTLHVHCRRDGGAQSIPASSAGPSPAAPCCRCCAAGNPGLVPASQTSAFPFAFQDGAIIARNRTVWNPQKYRVSQKHGSNFKAV